MKIKEIQAKYGLNEYRQGNFQRQKLKKKTTRTKKLKEKKYIIQITQFEQQRKQTEKWTKPQEWHYNKRPNILS